eukprot:2549254-Alexandrium_andersonii.AAC.1
MNEFSALPAAELGTRDFFLCVCTLAALPFTLSEPTVPLVQMSSPLESSRSAASNLACPSPYWHGVLSSAALGLNDGEMPVAQASLLSRPC